MTGSVVGTRADRLPRPVRGRLSLEGRDDFSPYDVPASPLLSRSQPGEAPVEVSASWPYEFIRRTYPMREIALEPHAGRPPGPMTIAWVVPNWRIGSGGHTTIFRLIQQLERRGHRCVINLFDPFDREPRSAARLRHEIRESFIEVEAEVFKGFDDFGGADVCVATNWWTAYPVRDLPGCKDKVYLVQDDEPQFYATSAESIWARETYRMGYRCIAYTPWMADILTRDYGLEAHWFECGTDTDTYAFSGLEDRVPGRIAVYARRETERRAVDLALAGLATLFERRPGLDIVLFGSNLPAVSPVPARNLGVRSPRELAQLYATASAGIVFSLTTHSLVAQEMMASGLPLVELDGDNVGSALGASGELALLSEPRPDAIADALEQILDRPGEAARMARRARAFVEERTWERAGDQVESALFDFLARPRVQAALVS
jgi:glycosyltransferase involved in cell wall biosynthesis